MKFLLLLLAGGLCGLTAVGQPTNANRIDATPESSKRWAAWANELHNPGLSLQKDTLRISEEIHRLARDAAYRASLYPEAYTWPPAVQLMQKMELKKAFWHFINLYANGDRDRTLVLYTVCKYERVMDMETIMVNAFYTYALLDPKVCVLKNGKPNVTRPDLLDKKFRQLQEIVAYLREYRKTPEGKKATEARAILARSAVTKR